MDRVTIGADAGVTPTRRRHAHVTVVLLALGVSAGGVLMSALPLLSLYLEQALSLSGIQVGLAMGAAGLGLTGALLISGGIADRLGYRRAFLAGTVVSILGAGLTGWSISFPILVAGLLIAGIGLGLQMVTAMAAIADLTPTTKVQSYAMFEAIFIVVGALGSVVAGIMASSPQARLAFVLGIPLSAASGVGIAWMTKNPSATSFRKWDPLGMTLSVVASATLFVGISLLVRDAANPISIIVAGAGAASFLLFVWWERSRSEPLLDLRVLRNRAFVTAVLTATLATFGIGGTLVVITQYAQFVLDLDTKTAAVIIAAISALDALASLASPVLMRWFGARLLLGGSLTVAAGACVVATLWSGADPAIMPVVAFAVVSIALATIIAPIRSLVAESLPSESMGAGFGLFGMVRRFALVIGMAVVVGVFTATFSSTLYPALKTQGLDSPQELSVSSVGKALEMRKRMFDELGPEQSRRLLEVQHGVFMQAQQRGFTVAATSLGLAVITSLFLPRRGRRKDE